MLFNTVDVAPLKHLLAQLWYSRWYALLFLLMLASALAVILSSHKNRQLVTQIEQQMQKRDHLEIEWRLLVLEQGALTEHNRIEGLVTDKLSMHRPPADSEVVVRMK